MRAVITTLVLLWLALLSGVANAGSRAQARALETTQAAYTAAVRWNDFDTAQGFVEPAYARRIRSATWNVRATSRSRSPATASCA